MKNNYILIDFENVQPKNLGILKGRDFKVILFVGAHQNKVSFELANAMQSLGDNAEYIKIEGNGPNALDFHIAFYIGQIAAADKNCFFHIISKDKGFDPLIRHLATKKIFAMREKSIAEIPLLNLTNVKSTRDRVAAIIEHLRSRGNAKPRTIKTLSNTINSLFAKKLKEQEITALVEELLSNNIVIQNEKRITYQLPIVEAG